MGSGGAVALFEIEIAYSKLDAQHVPRAAEQFRSNNPFIEIFELDDRVRIAGNGCSHQASSHWKLFLLNERLISDASTRRVAILRSLVA